MGDSIRVGGLYEDAGRTGAGISDACFFHGLLLLSARSYAETSRDATYHVTALKHKSECIRLVNEALEIPGRATSDAIVAVVLMLAVEEVSAVD